MKREKEGSRQREQHMQRPRGWLREELQSIGKGRGQSSDRHGERQGARLRRGHRRHGLNQREPGPWGSSELAGSPILQWELGTLSKLPLLSEPGFSLPVKEGSQYIFFLGGGGIPWHMEFPGQGSDVSHSCGNTRPGIEPVSWHSRDAAAAKPIAPQQELPQYLFLRGF